MAKVLRVHQIAKELGVDSKAIVEKCKAESIPGVDTHMSPVKVGLAQTIREWFSTSHEHVTAVETAAPVDLVKVRKPSRKRAKPVDAPGEADTVTAVAAPEAPTPTPAPVAPAPVIEAPAPALVEESPVVAPTASAPEAVVETPAPPAEPVAPSKAAKAHHPAPPVPTTPAPTQVTARKGHGHAPVTPPSPAPGAPTAAAGHGHGHGHGHRSTPKSIKPVGRVNVPTRPDVVAPAGPKLVQPQQVQLRGPKVVRIEQPDVVATPRPRRGPSGPRPGGPAGGQQQQGDLPGILRSRGPARGKGAGAPQGEEEVEAKPAAGKRRSLTTRRGRSAEALPTGPTKFTEADIAELDAKLNRAAGYVKLRRRELKKHGGSQQALTPAVTGGRVAVEEPITIKSLSAATGIKTTDIIKYLFKKGVMATINSAISNDMAQEVAMEYEIELEVKQQQTLEQQLVAQFDTQEAIDIHRRPPIVTIMGHVDHGKTSLLDKIRATDVAAHEAGGITQHIGAYRVTIKGSDSQNKTVVFLDTPGHEAFTTLRARGAAVTDLVVLVVSAADGVMPQTIESINHAKAAKVPLIVALNKIDRPDATEANIRKIFGQLAEHGLNPVEWGGTTEVCKVSAVQGIGVTELLELLDLQAEILDLKADYGGAARGTIIEAMMSPGRGPVARLLVQQGTLKIGDFIVAGRAYGRVRDVIDDRGHTILEAGPATPVELSGLDVLPDAGDKFYCTDSLQKAEEIATQFREKERLVQLASQTKVTLENFAQQMAAKDVKELRVVLKADVQGSVDVLKKSLTDLSTAEVKVNILHAAVGGVTESDVLLADASDAVVIGFNVVAPAIVRDLAEQRSIEIRSYRVIYDITEEVKKAMEGMLEPEVKEEILGTAEVREVFHISKLGTVAGCMVSDGTIQRAHRVRVARQDIVVIDNREIDSLKRFKEDAKEVRAGMECGIKIVGFDDLKTGDKIICYQTVTVKRKLGG